MQAYSNMLIQQREAFLHEVIGNHRGLWSGYEISFIHDNKLYKVKTIDGVRGIDIPVEILISELGISFNTVK